MDIIGDLRMDNTSTIGTKRCYESRDDGNERNSDNCTASVSTTAQEHRKRNKASHTSFKHAAKTASDVQYRTGVHVVTVPTSNRLLNWHDAVTGDVRTISLKSCLHDYVIDLTCSRVAVRLSASTRRFVCVYSLESGEQLSEFTLAAKIDRSIHFSNDGKKLACWGEGALMIHNVDDGTQVLINKSFWSKQVTFGSDDTCLYFADCNSIGICGIWKIELGNEPSEPRMAVPLYGKYCALVVAATEPFGVLVDEVHLTVWNSMTNAVEFSAKHSLIFNGIGCRAQIGGEDSKILIGWSEGLAMWGNNSNSVGDKEWTPIWSIPVLFGVVFCVCGSVTLYLRANVDKHICIVDSATGEELDRLPPFVSRIGRIVYQSSSVILL